MKTFESIKRHSLCAAVVGLAVLTLNSCKKNADEELIATKTETFTYQRESINYEISVNGILQTHSYAMLDYLNVDDNGNTVHSDLLNGEIEMSHMPYDLQEFADIKNALYGKKDNFTGVIALQLMAFHLYSKNPESGEKAIREISTEDCANKTIETLKTTADTKPYYYASMLTGADKDNGFLPDEPYKMSIFWDKNPQHQYPTDYTVPGVLKGKLYYVTFNTRYTAKDNPVTYRLVRKSSGEVLIDDCAELFDRLPELSSWQYKFK